jgi:hypothetical protein
MTVIQQPKPVSKKQTKQDSCWAAVLHAWSRCDLRIHGESGFLDERDLVGQYGEGPTGGLVAEKSFPIIAVRFGLRYIGVRAEYLIGYLKDYLADSYVFCSIQRRPGSHALLIYKYDDDSGLISFMDPDGGRYRAEKYDFFDTKGPFLLSSVIKAS